MATDGGICSSCDSPLPEDAAFCPTCGAATPTSRATELPPGFAERFTAALAGRYRIEREVGRGGMALVYLAHDLRHERPVAVKVLRPELAASVGADRFLREIKLAARLTHQNVLALYDSGDADGFLYYVMPFVEGESLRQKLGRERQLPIDEALRLTREIAEGLEYAHEQGIIHRDIKPENVLLSRGHAVIADFGVAKAVAKRGMSHLTSTGTSVGTPLYMSPEQAGGDPNVDHRSDIYSLGCMLYEMLAGEPPFTGPTVQAVIAKHALDPRPGVRTLRDTVPVAIEAAIRRAMAKAPADRFAAVREFAQALAAAPPAAPPAAPDARLTQRRTGTWRTAAVVAAIVLVIAIVWVSDFPRGGSGAGYSDTPAWSAWGGWMGEVPSVVAVLDSSIVVSIPDADSTVLFDGRRWRGIPIPDGVALAWYVGVARGGRLLAVRRTAAGGLPEYAWLRLRTGGAFESETLRAPVEEPTRWWTDGSDLVVWGESVERLTPDGWVRELTGTAGWIVRLWGAAVDRRYALAASPSDSLLVYDGVNWRLADVFAGGLRESPEYQDGTTLGDGTTVLVGDACDREQRCRPFLLEQETWGGTWRELRIPPRIGLPSAWQRDAGSQCDARPFSFTGIWGESRDDYYVAGDWLWCDPDEPRRLSAGCPPGQPCLWHVTDEGLQPVEDLLGRLVVAMVPSGRDLYALTDDATLWRRVAGEWRVVSQVPGLPGRYVAASPLVVGRLTGDRFTFQPGRRDTVSPIVVSPEAGTPPGVGTTAPPRQLVARDTTMLLVAGDGVAWVSHCRMVPTLLERVPAPRIRCFPWEALPAPPGPVLASDVLHDGTILGVGAEGLAVAWRGGAVTREQVPPAAAGDRLWAVVATGSGTAAAAGTRTILERDSSGTWTVVRSLPESFGDGRYFAVAAEGEFVLAGNGIAIWDRSADTLPVALLEPAASERVELAALQVLQDGRLVAGYATPQEPMLGGRLVVWGTPLRENRWREVELPLRVDITGIDDDGAYLYVVGRGGSLAIPLDSLPFAGEMPRR